MTALGDLLWVLAPAIFFLFLFVVNYRKSGNEIWKLSFLAFDCDTSFFLSASCLPLAVTNWDAASVSLLASTPFDSVKFSTYWWILDFRFFKDCYNQNQPLNYMRNSSTCFWLFLWICIYKKYFCFIHVCFLESR